MVNSVYYVTKHTIGDAVDICTRNGLICAAQFGCDMVTVICKSLFWQISS